MITLKAIQRYKTGTGYSRYMRLVLQECPGIVYGKLYSEKSLLVSLKHNDLFKLQKKNKFFLEKLLLLVNNQSLVVKVQEIQYHAYKPQILHIDFLYFKS